MSGPTWEPSACTDDEAEWRLISPHLFGAPDTQGVVTGGGRLVDKRRRLEAWLTMVTGTPWAVGSSSPPTFHHDSVYLPPELNAPAQDDDDDVAYRIMALFQTELATLGAYRQQAWVRELFDDWVLQVSQHLLMCHAVIGSWTKGVPTLVDGLQRVIQDERLTQLWAGRQRVPSHELPPAFSRLLQPLCPVQSTPVPWIDDILELVGDQSIASMRVVLPGLAKRLREGLKSNRLGAPPLPFWVGVAHPSWFLGNPEESRRQANAWKKGPKPLQALLRSKRARRIDGEKRPATQFEAPPVGVSEDDGLRYPEWDLERSRYRDGVVRIVQEDAPVGPSDAVEQIRARNRARLSEIRAEFESLKLDTRWLHAQRDGPELDYPKVIQAVLDTNAGAVPGRNIYKRLQLERKNLAVLTLVDLSGSTLGGFLHEEQKAVVFFAEALGALGVPYSFYGFRSEGRKTCRFLRIRAWGDDPIDAAKRMGSLSAKGGSRLGAFIRHASRLLSTRPEENALLLIVSDGRPEDRDGYRGAYGLADSAMAVREAASAGIIVHCVSLADASKEYLPRVFGPHGYTVVPNADALPEMLPDVFRSVSWG